MVRSIIDEFDPNEAIDESTIIKIINWRHFLDLNNSMGARLSRNCKDIISKLCCDQDRRLGCKDGAKEIKRHPWFKVSEVISIQYRK